MTAELCYIGKTGTYRILSVSDKLMRIANIVGADAVDYSLAILVVHLNHGLNTAPYIFSTIPTNTGFVKWQDNLRYTFVAGYENDERLAFSVGSKVYYLVDIPVAIIDLYFRFRAKYNITVETKNVAPSTYVTYITTDSAIRVDLQYNYKPVQMKRTWYCRLKVYGTSGKKENLLYTSNTVTVAPIAEYCTIPKIDTNTGTASERPIKLYLEYSFDKSNWGTKLLHTFTESSTQAITCDDKTVEDSYVLETIYE